MSAEMITGLMMGSLIVSIMIGYPIAYVMGGLGTIFGFLFIGKAFSGIFVLNTYSVFADYTLVAVLLFIFMGVVIEKSGLASKLYESMYYIFGRLRGGLAVAVLITCTIFAAATGVIGASVVTMGLLALPTMLKYNYGDFCDARQARRPKRWKEH
ncbi:MAG: TRAP transporter large permease subunit, partial [Peptococcaceae bacterium]|nr:TRAP transporter large permease subunit [Peptococcaceae bacterium]